MTNHAAAPSPFENLAGKIESHGMQGGMEGAFHAQSEALTDLALASQLGRANNSDFSSAQIASMLDGGPNGFHLFDNASNTGGGSGSGSGAGADSAGTGGAGDIIKTVMGGFGALAAENTSNPWTASSPADEAAANDSWNAAYSA